MIGNFKYYILLFCFYSFVKTTNAQSDNCATATSIDVSSGTACVSGTTSSATSENITTGCNTAPVNEVWYQFTSVGTSNDIQINSSGLGDIVLVVDETGCGDGSISYCKNGTGTSSVTQKIDLPVGSTILVSVASNTGTEGNFQICIDSYTSTSTIQGDDCTTAIPYCNTNSSFTINDMTPFDGAPKPSCFKGAGSTPSQAAFLTFTITQTGTIAWTADPQASEEWDWALYNITNGCPGTEVSCNYNYTSASGTNFGMAGTTNSGEYNAAITGTAGETYVIMMNNWTQGGAGMKFTWQGTAMLSPTADFSINPSGTVCGSSVTVNISDNSIGVPTYNFGNGNTYTGNNPPSQTYTQTGTYAINAVIDGACPSVHTEYVELFGPLTITPAQIDESCPGACNGSAGVVVSGGSGDYGYIWGSGMGAPTSPNLNNLCSGSYTINISDNTCNYNESLDFNITSTPFTISVTPTNVSCYGLADGSATVTVTGTTASMTYTWSSGGNGTSVSNLTAGTYSVTANDGNCDVVQNFTITQPPQLLLTPSSTDETCLGACDGSGSVSQTGVTGTPQYIWSNGGNTSSISSLCQGSYSVTLTDSNTGCKTTSSITVNSGAVITADIASPGPNQCLDGNSFSFDGSGSTISIGSITSYTWNFGDGNSGSGATTSHTYATAGTFTTTLTVSNGSCSDQTTVSVVVYPSPTITLTPTDVSCNGGNDGAVAATASGTSAFSYSWSNGGSGNGVVMNLTGLTAGNYTVTLTDGNGCTVTDNATVNEPTTLSVTPSGNDPSCGGGTDGDVSAVATGGSSPYTYSWTAVGVGANQNGLAAGTYNVIVTDNKGCTVTDSYTLNEPSPIVPSTTVTNANCGAADGAISASATGGTPGYTFDWSNGFSGSNNAGLSANSYILTVTDNAGCTEIVNANVSDAGAPTLSIINVVSVSCNGGNNGSAEASVSGGVPTYTYNWSNGANTAVVSNLTAGNYTVTITDSSTPSACVATANVDIVQPTALNATIISFNDPSCPGSNDGDATINVVGGKTSYTFNWSSGGNSATENNLAAGTYTVSITDANSCPVSTTVTLTDPPAITVTAIGNGVSCNGGNNGAATIAVTGSNVPDTYLWSNGSVNQNPNNFTAGTYTVTVTDNTGCKGTTSVSISEPTALVLAISCTNISAPFAGDGASSANVSGGTPTYSYSWSNGQTTSGVSNLQAGAISVTVTDNNGCSATDNCVIIEPNCSVSIAVSSTSISCNGANDGTGTAVMNGGDTPYSYTWSNGANTQNVTGLATGNYYVTITDVNSCLVASSINITQPSALSLSESHINVDCYNASTGSINIFVSGGLPSYNYNWSNGASSEDMTNIPAGNYTVSVTDINNCLYTSSVNILQPEVLNITTTTDDISCRNDLTGQASVLVSGGTTPYSYNWNDALMQNTSTATGLKAGGYAVTITDFNGCQIRNNLTITEPSKLLLDSTVVSTSCNEANGAACVLASGGVSPYTYSWAGSTSCVSGLLAGTYNATVTDNNGCKETIAIIVNNLSGPSVTITSSTDVSCYGFSDGNATATVSGGDGTITYEWFKDGVSTGYNLPYYGNLTAGTYTIKVTDINNCMASDIIDVTQPTAISYNTNYSNPSCNGYTDGEASIIVDPNSGTSPFTYFWVGQTEISNTLSNISSGNYSLLVTDDNGCNVTLNYTLTDPLLLSATVTGTDATCFEQCNGSAVTQTANGVGGYFYNWSSGQSVPNPTGLCAGNYSVTISDANACFTVRSLFIDEPTPLYVTIADYGDLTCYQSCDGWIQSSPTGGTPPYNYSWTGGKMTETISALCAGNYTLEIQDNKGCTATVSQTITQPTALVLNVIDVQNVKCYGACNGSAQVQASGGTGPQYFYQWDINGNLSAAATATGLCANNNVCATVTDENGCIASNCIQITQPNPIQTTYDTIRSHCGQADGKITVYITGGTAPFSYKWSDPSIAASSIANNVKAGCYTLSITDNLGCEHSQTACISDIAGPVASLFNYNDATCNSSCDGLINFNLTGGTTPYASMNWYNESGTLLPTYNGSKTAWNLCGNHDYKFEATDAAGCKASIFQHIIDPSAVISAITQKTDILCFGGSNGKATVFAGGGTPGYTYLWNTSPSQTTTIATGLTAGVYTVQVKDANNCPDNTPASVTITQPDLLQVTSSVVDANCFGSTDGQVCLSADGGKKPYNYSWSIGANGNSCAELLIAGSYTTTVTDANGCKVANSSTVDQPAELVASISATDASCSGQNGSATLFNIVGGTAPYYPSWNSGAQSGYTAYSLPEGIAYGSIVDDHGCTFSTLINIINHPGPKITGVIIDKPTCYGYTDGQVTVNVTGGTSPLSYNWNPTSQTSQIASNLPAGTYVVDVIDANTCADIFPVVVKEPSEIKAIGYASDSVICYGQSVVIWGTPSGGTTPYPIVDGIEWSGDGAGLTGYGPHNIKPKNTFNDYYFTVYDQNGCFAQNSISVYMRTPLVLSAPDSIWYCIESEGQIRVTGYGGKSVDDYVFSWSNGFVSDSSNTDTLSVSKITVDEPGSTAYRVILSDGCSPNDTAYIPIIVYPKPDGAFSAVNQKGCPPFTTQFPLSSSFSNVTFSWDMNGDGVADTDASSVFEWTYKESGVYDVLVTITTEHSCENVLQEIQYITVYPDPIADFIADPQKTTIINPIIKVDASLSIGADSLLFWQFGDGNSGKGMFTENMYNAIGNYWIQLTVWNDYGCFDIDSQLVVIDPGFTFYSPNAFTPDGDGFNDVFFPRGVGFDYDKYQMIIIDRWGTEIFSSQDPDKGWDGTIDGSGNKCPEGVYIWKVIVTDITSDQQEHQFVGHVTLLK